MDIETINGFIAKLEALENAIRAKDFDKALEIVRKDDAPFLWTPGGRYLGGEVKYGRFKIMERRE